MSKRTRTPISPDDALIFQGMQMAGEQKNRWLRDCTMAYAEAKKAADAAVEKAACARAYLVTQIEAWTPKTAGSLHPTYSRQWWRKRGEAHLVPLEGGAVFTLCDRNAGTAAWSEAPIGASSCDTCVAKANSAGQASRG